MKFNWTKIQKINIFKIESHLTASVYIIYYIYIYCIYFVGYIPLMCMWLYSVSPGWAQTCGRCGLVTRRAPGVARRPRCSTSWRTACRCPAASPRTWTRPPSCGWHSATCACNASSPQVGTHAQHKLIHLRPLNTQRKRVGLYLNIRMPSMDWCHRYLWGWQLHCKTTESG